MSPTSLQNIVFEEIQEILVKKGRKNTKLSPQTKLFGSGAPLDSLDVAELVVRLEERLSVDPFKETSGLQIRNLGDFIRCYEKHGKQKKNNLQLSSPRKRGSIV